MSCSHIDLSLIIACYNEELVLRESIKQIFEILDNARFSYEIIFVDDFSQDNTRKIIEDIISEYPDKRFKKIFHEKNTGRGSAVTEGIKLSKGQIVGFIDLDLSTPARYIPTLAMEIKKGAGVASALRVYKLNWSAVPRWVLSKGYRFLVRLLLRLDLKDTETGCKFFNRERILPILDEVRDSHWFWDTEIMARSRMKGLKIAEIPSVFMRKGLYSRVKIFRDSFYYLIKLIRFRKELVKSVKK